MAGEQGFEEGAAGGRVPAAPLPGSPVPDWDPDLDGDEPEAWDDLSPEELGVVDPMSPEDLAGGRVPAAPLPGAPGTGTRT